MRFVLSIELGNAAMQTPRDVLDAIRQSLARTHPDQELGTDDGGKIRDVNGNTVGSWRVGEDS